MWTQSLLKTKLKATAIHLSISLVIFAVLAYLIIFHWYPVPFFGVDGGWQGIRLIALVDMVLGPLITFLIFDLAKSRRAILFDIAVISIFQIGALIYGIHATYTQRPIAAVFMDEFVFPATIGLYQGTLTSTDKLSEFSPEAIPMIYAEYPTDRVGFEKALRIKKEEKIPEYAQLSLYRDHAAFVQYLNAMQSVYFGKLSRVNKEPALNSWLEKNHYDKNDVLIAPLNGRYGRAWLLFNQEGRYINHVTF